MFGYSSLKQVMAPQLRRAVDQCERHHWQIYDVESWVVVMRLDKLEICVEIETGRIFKE